MDRFAALIRAIAGGGLTTRPRMTPIVPAGSIAGQALVLVVAIMSFLACMTAGAVQLVGESASAWQSQISREATIQIRPAENFDIETALIEAQAIAAGYAGVKSATIIDRDQTAELLEPWLGSGLDLDELPVPRLVIVTIDETAPPDFAAMRTAVSQAIPNATLDDHRAWVDRLVSMARTTTLVGILVFILVCGALVLTVVFATRGALAGNQAVIEVLHFVGARAGFIAGQFQRRFLMIGVKGALIGGALSLVLFLAVSFWLSSNLTSAEQEQVAILFGSIAPDGTLIAIVLAIAVAVGAITAVTARITVLRTLHEIDEKRADPSII